ncbi:MAG: hypothetical protein HY600_04180, partial [Candidatus Omnitrophica bacterium]|nr:hypothetical protein [Candidatus Omnitrophota bacterium]
ELLGQLAEPGEPSPKVRAEYGTEGATHLRFQRNGVAYLASLTGRDVHLPVMRLEITREGRDPSAPRISIGAMRLGITFGQPAPGLELMDASRARSWLRPPLPLQRIWSSEDQMREFLQAFHRAMMAPLLPSPTTSLPDVREPGAAAGLEERPRTAAEAVAAYEEAVGPAPLLHHGMLPTTVPGRALVMATESDPAPIVLGLMGWQVTVVHPTGNQAADALQRLETSGLMAEVARRRGTMSRHYTPTAPFRRHRELGALPSYILISEFSEVNRWWPTPPDEKDAASNLVGEIARTIAPGGTIVVSGQRVIPHSDDPDGAALLRSQLDRFAVYRVREITTVESAALLPVRLWCFDIASLQGQWRGLVARIGRWTGRDLIVIHPDVITMPEYRGLGVLAELLPNMVCVDRGDETMEVLRASASSGVTHVDYYGEQVRADAIRRLTGLTVDHQPLSLRPRFSVLVERILAHLAGRPEGAAGIGRLVEIEPIAAWLEQAA